MSLRFGCGSVRSLFPFRIELNGHIEIDRLRDVVEHHREYTREEMIHLAQCPDCREISTTLTDIFKNWPRMPPTSRTTNASRLEPTCLPTGIVGTANGEIDARLQLAKCPKSVW